MVKAFLLGEKDDLRKPELSMRGKDETPFLKKNSKIYI